MASGSTSPRVMARLADSRRRILDAARVVVAERGFAGAQVAVVASVADVATGSVYRHFPSKASLFAEMLRTVCQRELAVVQAVAAEPGRRALDRIGDGVSAFADRALRGEGLAYAVIVEPMDPEVDAVRLEARADLAAVFAGLIEEGVAAGELPPQEARLSGAAIVGALLEALVAPLARGGGRPSERRRVTGDIARFCQAAVSGPPPPPRPTVGRDRRGRSTPASRSTTGRKQRTP